MNDIPRRIRMDQMTPAELAITEAITLIEAMGADERLTKAQTLLAEARNNVADYVDSKPSESTSQRLVHSAVPAGRHLIVTTYYDGDEDPPHPGKAVKTTLLFRTVEDVRECARVLNDAMRPRRPI